MLLISFTEKIAFSLLVYSRDFVFMRSIIAFFRVLGVFAVLIGGIGALVLTSPMASRRASHKIYMSFKGILLWVVGIKVHGQKFDKIGPGLIIANHRSYLDVLFIPTEEFFTIVGKIEVRSWPLIGWAGRALGTIWVKRESKNSRSQTKEAISNAVKDGETVVLFPEGTSWEGPLLLPVRPGMFYEAADQGFKLYQWSLHFDDATTGFPPKIPFGKHLWELCKRRNVNAYTEVREIPISGTDGTKLCNDAISWWNESLSRLNEKYPMRNAGFWPDDRVFTSAIYERTPAVKG